MVFRLIFFSVLLLVHCATAQHLSNTDVLVSKLNRMETSLRSLGQRNDSLRRELQFYKIKEDYFVNAIDRQATHFEFLISILIGGAALISWGVFNRTIENQKKLFDSKITTLELKTSTAAENYVQANKESFQKINNIIKSFGYDIAHTDMDKAFSHLNDAFPILALNQIFGGVYKLVQVYKYLKESDHIGYKSTVHDIKMYIQYADEFLKECNLLLEHPASKVTEKKLAESLLTKDPMDFALELNEPEITKLVTEFYIKYRSYLKSANS